MSANSHSSKTRIVIDRTFALVFRPDIVKISFDSEAASFLCEASAGQVVVQGHDR